MQPLILTPEPLEMAHSLAKDWNFPIKMPPQLHLPQDPVGSSYAPALNNRTAPFARGFLMHLFVGSTNNQFTRRDQNKITF